MNFELDCNALLTNKPNSKKKSHQKRKLITTSCALMVNQPSKRESPLTLTALTSPPHKNSPMQELFLNFESIPRLLL
jgi:hypothetical protein